MELLKELETKLDTMSKEYKFLLEENKKLRQMIHELRSNNDVVTKDSQDMLEIIRNKLNISMENNVETDNISHQ